MPDRTAVHPTHEHFAESSATIGACSVRWPFTNHTRLSVCVLLSGSNSVVLLTPSKFDDVSVDCGEGSLLGTVMWFWP